MKLASLKHGRDGRLLVVSRDLTQATDATHIAPTLQHALDNWREKAESLEQLYHQLNLGEISDSFEFQASACASPLPRAYQWLDASAYVNHVALVRKARGAELPPEFWTDPLVYQGGSDDFLGPRDPIPLVNPQWGCDFEAEVAVITDDVAMGCGIEQAEQSIRLIMLVNDISLRGLIPQELAKGFGFYQSKPASAFSPVAVTPDELGQSWGNGKVSLPILCNFNGAEFGRTNAGVDMTFNFPQLIQHAAKTRHLCAGSIVGSGTVSNRDADGGPGKTIAEGGDGYSCIAELRMIETIQSGNAQTPFMTDGDRIKIEMLDDDDQTLFGAIEQSVRQV